jgi:chondroitin-sulfate-ABC endolyase/exolyase
MAQRYSVSPSLSGRLIGNETTAASVAISKAMCLLADPNGLNDVEMQERFAEFFDAGYFFSDGRMASYYRGRRGVPIRGLGIYRLISDVRKLAAPPAATPSGTWIKPYAAGAFHRRDDWLVTARGFSRYFWDYEGPLNKHQNSFGQNWSYGLLQVFSAGEPVSALGSGYDLDHGWDWYHVPGTTASHYPVEERTEAEVIRARRAAGIRQRDTHRNYSRKTFVGGVSLGDHGLFVHDLEAVPFTSPTDLVARKSYFFVGDMVLALGSHISGGTAEDETHTTLFQTRLRDASIATTIDGQTRVGLDTVERLSSGQAAAMTDSVGNSYYLADSSAELVVRRDTQQSMTPQYKPTEGDYATAWINHGVKPRNDHYQYVVIPADEGGRKLKRLAEDPSAYYRVLDRDRMHLVYFPGQQITAYAFYERVETPDTHLVKSSNLHATVMTQQRGAEIQLAASVPDLGWESDVEELRIDGLGYASKNYYRQEAKLHRLRLTLRGRWKLAEASPAAGLHVKGAQTILELNCKDGLTEQLVLAPVE